MMMMAKRMLMVAAMLGWMSLTLACSSSGPVDVKYPTVAQMDALDVQWGLPKRKARGTPSRMYSAEGASTGQYVAPAPTAPALPDPPLELPGAAPAPLPEALR